MAVLMKPVSCLMALTVGAVLVALTVPRAVAAAPPCDKLLTLQDVTKAAGPGFNAPAKNAEGVLGPGCFYSRRTAQADYSTLEEDVHLILKEVPGGAAPLLASLSTSYKNAGAPVEAVSGLGPGAFYLEDKRARSATVLFAKGNVYLQLFYKVGKRSDPKAALGLARVVYARL